MQWLTLLTPSAGGTSSIPGWGTKIPHARRHLSPRASTTEPRHSRAHVPQRARALRRKHLPDATNLLSAATKTQCCQISVFLKNKTSTATYQLRDLGQLILNVPQPSLLYYLGIFGLHVTENPTQSGFNKKSFVVHLMGPRVSNQIPELIMLLLISLG